MYNIPVALFIFLFVFITCNSTHEKKREDEKPPVHEIKKKKEIFEAGKVISSLSCSGDASQGFALYLPKKFSDSIKYPAIIFLDPHGDGSFPLNKYFPLAEKFGFVIIGSNNSRNGMQFDQTNAIINILMNELTNRFSVDAKRISVAGFSGGAKAALVCAMSNPQIMSVIYCGAALPAPNQQFPSALGFAGKRDLNYTEVLSFNDAMKNNNTPHCIIEWNGKHEWTDSIVFADAFYFCAFTAMRHKTKAKDDEMVKYFLKKNNSSSLSNSLSRYAQLNKLISFLNNLSDVSSFEKERAALVNSSAFKKEITAKNNVQQMEIRLKQNYMQCFDSQNLNWWKTEIERMKSIKGNDAMMEQRLLAYVSLACYSMSSKAIKQNNFSSAEKTLAIYKIADAENPDHPFLIACMYARQGDNAKTIAALNDAIKLGLKDKTKIETEDAFVNLKSLPEFRDLLSKL